MRAKGRGRKKKRQGEASATPTIQLGTEGSGNKIDGGISFQKRTDTAEQGRLIIKEADNA